MLILFAMLAFTTYALRNPFAVYCSALGYEYATRETADGTEGFCKVSGSVECSAYDFLMGNCGTDYNYCSKKGYQQRPGKGLECGTDTQSAQCLMCVLPNGSTKEVTILMNLSFREGVCGDGACVVGENSQ